MPDTPAQIFYATLAFGFTPAEVLHQMWVDNLGNVEWRAVPMIEMTAESPKPQSIAGYVPAEDGKDGDA